MGPRESQFGKCIIAIAASAVVFFSACSDDKTPPDDGKDGKAATAKAACTAETENAFRLCAQEVLATSGLSSAERRSLSSCDFNSATPETSKEDLFEAARATVRAHCL